MLSGEDSLERSNGVLQRNPVDDIDMSKRNSSQETKEDSQSSLNSGENLGDSERLRHEALHLSCAFDL